MTSPFRSKTVKNTTETEIRKNVGKNIQTDFKITNRVETWKNNTKTKLTSENSMDSLKQNVIARRKKRCRPSKCKFYNDTNYKGYAFTEIIEIR